MNETQRLPGQEVAICPCCSSPIPLGRASSCLPGMALLLQPCSSCQLLALPWGLSPSHAPGVSQEEQCWLSQMLPAWPLFKKSSMKWPHLARIWFSRSLPVPASWCSLFWLKERKEEGNATCPACPLGSNRYTCLASWLESYPCTAALQHCWWVEAVDGQESKGRAGEGAWKWLGWGFSW